MFGWFLITYLFRRPSLSAEISSTGTARMCCAEAQPPEQRLCGCPREAAHPPASDSLQTYQDNLFLPYSY